MNKQRVKRVQDIETDEQALNMIKDLSDGIEDEMMMKDYYEQLAKYCPTRMKPMEEPVSYTPREKMERVVFVFGLDLV